MLGQASSVNPSQPNERKFFILTYVTVMSVYECNFKITFKISYVIFYLPLISNLHYTSPV